MYRPNCMIITNGVGGVHVNRLTDGDMIGSLVGRVHPDDLVAVEEFLLNATPGQDIYVCFADCANRALLVKITPGVNARMN